ncbi:MAG: uroporphyrinogen decarboxylase family protein [Desulfovermiculus sp.]
MSSMQSMTPMERVLTTLGHKEPDRVPFFLLATMHGAKELQLSIQDYFSRAEHVAQGQIALQQKYGHDCYYNLFYTAIEAEAWGGDVVFYHDGPPNSAAPIIRDPGQIHSLAAPDVQKSPVLLPVLEATRMLALHSAGKIPIIGVAVSPFSLPVMQMGFEPYIELMYNQRELFNKFMAVNETFCAHWANAQLAAGGKNTCNWNYGQGRADR